MKKFKNGYAIIIGTGSDENIIKTVNDAEGLYEVLIDEKRAAYPSEQVQLLVKEQATKEGIVEAFKKLKIQTEGNKRASVIIFYAGHGEVGDGDGYYMIPHNFDEDNEETRFYGHEFHDLVDDLTFGKLTVFIDCCHAAGISYPVEELGADDLEKQKKAQGKLVSILSKGKGKVIVASSQEFQKSYILKGKDYTVFGECLLEVLSGETVRTEYVTILDVLKYLMNEVPKRLKGYDGISQQPFINEIENLNQDYILCRNPNFDKKELIMDYKVMETNQLNHILGERQKMSRNLISAIDNEEKSLKESNYPLEYINSRWTYQNSKLDISLIKKAIDWKKERQNYRSDIIIRRIESKRKQLDIQDKIIDDLETGIQINTDTPSVSKMEINLEMQRKKRDGIQHEFDRLNKELDLFFEKNT